jgi:hypothetical protein
MRLPNQPAKSLPNGPLDSASLELHSDAIAVVRHLLTVNHLPADRFIAQRSHLYRVARSPDLFREQASAVRTYIVSVRLLFPVGTHRLTVPQAHHEDDREPLFRSATWPVVQKDPR